MNDDLKLIAIVGMPGAGKSAAAQFFKNKGIPILRFGDQTDIGLKELDKDINEANERWYRESIRKELGMTAMAIKIEPRIREAAKTQFTIVLDGLYSWEEYLFLQEKFPQIKLLCIYAQPFIRYERLAKRPIRPLTPEVARSRDFAEIQNLNKGGPIAVADYLIQNETDIETFNKELEKFYQSLV